MAFTKDDIKNFSCISSLYYVVLNESEYIQNLSENWESLLGYPLETIYSTSYWNLIHPEDLQKTAMYLVKVAQGQDQVFTTRLLKKNGDEATMLWSARRGEDGRLYGVAQEVSRVLQEEPGLRGSAFNKESFLLKLTETETKIFNFFEDRKNKLVTRKDLCAAIYGENQVQTQTLNVHIYNLRKKLEEHPYKIKGVGKSGWMLILCNQNL